MTGPAPSGVAVPSGAVPSGAAVAVDERIPALEPGDAAEVWIDQDSCTGDGICVTLAREVFELDIDGLAYVKGDDDELRTEPGATVPVPAHLILDVVQSAKECPGECIHLRKL